MPSVAVYPFPLLTITSLGTSPHSSGLSITRLHRKVEGREAKTAERAPVRARCCWAHVSSLVMGRFTAHSVNHVEVVRRGATRLTAVNILGLWAYLEVLAFERIVIGMPRTAHWHIKSF